MGSFQRRWLRSNGKLGRERERERESSSCSTARAAQQKRMHVDMARRAKGRKDGRLLLHSTTMIKNGQKIRAW